MSLQIFFASDDKLREHMVTCNVRFCSTCQDIIERWAIEDRARQEDEWRREIFTDENLRKQEGR